MKVICDPNQAIYGFRGGVTRELTAFAATFTADERMPMSGNFRSSQHIARAVVAFRPPSQRALIDDALSDLRDEPTPVQILSHTGKGGVPAAIYAPVSLGRSSRVIRGRRGHFTLRASRTRGREHRPDFAQRHMAEEWGEERRGCSEAGKKRCSYFVLDGCARFQQDFGSVNYCASRASSPCTSLSQSS